MKLKKLFALALAVCMMVSVMPTAFAGNGFLSLDGVQPTTTTSGPSLTLDNPGTVSGGSGVTPSVYQPMQSSVLYSTDSGTGETGGESASGGENSGTLNSGTGTGITGGILGGGTTTGGTTGGSTPATLVTDAKNGLEVKKAVSENGDKITLEAWVTGEEVTVTVKEGEPVEIVLVLDRSARMLVTAENGKTKMENLQTAAADFLKAVQEKSSKSRVAIVSYANEGDSTVDTGEPDDEGVRPATVGALVPITEINAETGLEQVNSDLTGAIGDLEASGNAYSDEALGKAAKILQDLTKEEPDNDNKRMVILFTAGIPGSSSNTSWNTTAYEIAQASIHWGVILKAETTTNVALDANQEFYSGSLDTADMAQYTGYTQGCAASVFCVGIDLDSCESGHYHGSADAACNGTKINEYLYRISSHREDGSHVGCKFEVAHLLLCSQENFYNSWETEPKNCTFLFWTKTCWTFNYLDQYTRGNVTGSKITGTKYYQAGDIEDVGSMFEEISNDITTGGSSNETLTSDTIVQDVISPYFQIPENGNVTAYSVAYDGKDAAGNLKWVSSATTTYEPKIEENKVSVSGFNFSDNWVGTSSGKNHGQKLVIEIDIEPNSGFLGGNGVPTNDDAQAGVFLNQELIENFPNEKATAKINVTKIDPVVVPQNIYLSNAAALQALLSTTQDARINGTNNKYVDITYTIYEGTDTTSENKKIVGTYTVPRGRDINGGTWSPKGENAVWSPVLDKDATYTVVCTVDGGDNVNVNKQESAKPVTVSVFTPEITFEDSIIYLTDVPEYLGTNYEKDDIAWVNDNKAFVEKDMRGTAPDATITFDPASSAFAECTPVNVISVLLGDVEDKYEALSYVNFKNGESEHAGNAKYNNGTSIEEFTVHVLTPIVNIEDQVIYLSQSVTTEQENSGLTVQWNEHCGHNKTLDKKPELKATFKLKDDTSNVYADSISPEECKTFVAYPVIGGVVASTVEKEFKVHVLVPTVKVDDFAMHLSTSVNLEERTSTTWACPKTCEEKDTPKNATNGRTVPEGYGYNFYDGTTTVETVYSPDFDKTITVIPKVGVKEYTDYSKTFAIDVLMPIVTVPKKEVWADMNASVDMDEWYGITASNIGWDAPYNEEMEIVTEAPTGITFDYDFTVTKGVTDGNGHWADEMEHEKYIQGSADSLMTVTKATWTYAKGKSYEAVGDHLIINSEYDFKININKFKAIITNNGIQNAIYTLSNGTKVAVPAKGSVTVAGLICGKDYEISEANNDWTWRYGEAASAKDAAGNEKEYISCKVNEVKASDTPESSDSVFMTYGNITNPKWLADEDCVVNNAATPNCTIPVKKEDDEEVTNV